MMRKRLLTMLSMLTFVFVFSQAVFATGNLTISNFTVEPEVFNPEEGNTSFQFVLEGVASADVTLDIVDTNAAVLLRTLQAPNLVSGNHTLYWDGKDNSAEPVAEGDYTARLTAISTATVMGEPEFEKKWGGYGAAPGQLTFPNGIDTDSQENVYVANSNRVDKFNAEGLYLGSLTGLYYPLGVCAAANGTVLVADTYNHRIVRYNSEGNMVQAWGSLGSAAGQFNYPFGIDTDSNGNIYVMDRHNHRVQKFDSQGNFLSTWGTYGSRDGQFNHPKKLHVDKHNRVIVADSNNIRVQVFTNDGGFLFKFGGGWANRGRALGQFYTVEDVATDSAGNFYVADDGNKRVQIHDPNGAYIGQVTNNFAGPSALEIDSDGNLYIADSRGHEVHKFTITSTTTQVSDTAETTITVVNTPPDTSPPETWAEVEGTEGDNGWYTGPVTVTLSATDDVSGVESIWYRVDGNDFTVGNSLTLAAEGEHMISYYAVDNAGNSEEIRTLTVPIDTTPPVVTVTSPQEAEYERKGSLAVEVTASDSASGVASVNYYLDDNPFTATQIDLLHLGAGEHTFVVTATDLAGMTTTSTVSFSVTITAASIQESITEMVASGDIAKPGIANSLIKKLNAKGSEQAVVKRLEALLNEVEAQQGKHISPDAAEQLCRDVLYLLR